MQIHELSAAVAAKAVGGVVALSGAALVAVQAAGQIPAPAPPTSHTLADWLPWLFGLGGIWFLGQLGRVAAEALRGFFGVWIEGKKKLREVDAASDHGKYVECRAEVERLNAVYAADTKTLNERIRRQDDELAHSYATIGQKTAQIDHHIREKAMLLETNETLIRRLTGLSAVVGRNNSNLVAQIAETTRRSDPVVPVEVKIAADSEPVPVRPVDSEGASL